jgi:hypothetical protein
VIVQANPDHLLLITQPDHAALAGQVMAAWQNDGLPASPRRVSILHAVGEHDNGWHEVDRAPVIDAGTGRVLDFVEAPDALRQAVWPRGVERLAATPYVAALVAQHALVIYESQRDNPAWQRFFADMAHARDRHLAAAPPFTLDDLFGDYFFVRMGDLVSLTFCAGWLEPRICAGYEVHWTGTQVTVRPDPFGGRQVALAIEARALPNRSFGEAFDAPALFATAPRVTLTAVATGP